MLVNSIEEFEEKLREICIREGWLPCQEDIEALKKDMLDEIDSFWVSNYFSVKTECYYKSKFVVVSFLHKPAYPHNSEFAGTGVDYHTAFENCLDNIQKHIEGI